MKTKNKFLILAMFVIILMSFSVSAQCEDSDDPNKNMPYGDYSDSYGYNIYEGGYVTTEFLGNEEEIPDICDEEDVLWEALCVEDKGYFHEVDCSDYDMVCKGGPGYYPGYCVKKTQEEQNDDGLVEEEIDEEKEEEVIEETRKNDEEETKEDLKTCVETDHGADYYKRGVTQDLTQTKIDFCGEEYRYLTEYYCFNGKVDNEVYACEKGQYCFGGRCGVIDQDADAVPDQLDECLNTAIGDLVDISGCSCTQGADRVIQITENGKEEVECNKLENQNNLCQNSIKDKGELFPDCGGECEPCKVPCTKVLDGGNINVLLVPLEYSSSRDDSTTNNFYDWKIRVAYETKNLVTTPPFCEGPDNCELTIENNYELIPGKLNSHVTVWRLDSFMIDADFEKSLFDQNKILEEYSIKGYYDYLSNHGEQYDQLCSGAEMDVVVFTSSMYGASLGIKGKGIILVYTEQGLRNLLAHEMGHAFCGLDDEYVKQNSNTDLMGPTEIIEAFLPGLKLQHEGNKIINGEEAYELLSPLLEGYNMLAYNCDPFPEVYDEEKEKWVLYEGNEHLGVPVCKWQREDYPSYTTKDGMIYDIPYVPDAGCVPGCLYSEKLYRPAKDFEDSMMNSNYVVGPGPEGLGTWNKVGYAVCKEKVDSYN